jgi:CBS domain containing-hemolysin-like protein
VPESRPIDDLLTELQGRTTQVTVIIDEWGALEGIVTVGEIRDEFDTEAFEPSIDDRDDGTYAIDGRVPIREANDALGADFETVGGLLLDYLGRAPEVGDRVELDGYSLQAEAVDGTRIAEVLVRARERREVDSGGTGEPEEPEEPKEASETPSE